MFVKGVFLLVQLCPPVDQYWWDPLWTVLVQLVLDGDEAIDLLPIAGVDHFDRDHMFSSFPHPVHHH
jgi:hypothetical protein